MSGGEVRDVGLMRRHARERTALKRQVKRLRTELQRARASATREKRGIRAAAAPVLSSMQATEAALRKALGRCEEIGPEHLIQLDNVIRDAGLLRRLWFGLRFAFTRKVV